MVSTGFPGPETGVYYHDTTRVSAQEMSMAGRIIMTSESSLLRLPPPLSEAVDRAVENFAKERGLRTYRRWRATLAAYSDEPNSLLFIPDMVVTTGYV